MRGGQADRGVLPVSPLAQPAPRGALWRGCILLAAVLAVALVAGIAIAATRGGHATPPAPQRVVGEPVPSALAYAPHAPAPAAANAARTFLSGYLAYLYGKAGAAQIRDASPQLISALSQRGPAAAPAARKLHPAVVGLGAVEATGSVLHVTAMISDGIARYPVRIVMVHGQRGWGATQLSNGE